MVRQVTENEGLPRRSTASAAEQAAPSGWQSWVKANWFFSPLLLGYVLIVVAGRGEALGADAGRYIDYASALLGGSYLPSGSQQLWVGPGYPLVLMPFTPAGAWLPAALMNAGFMLGAVLYFHATLRLYVSASAARLGAVALGLYVPALLWLPVLMTEPLAFFLVAGLIYHACRLHGQPRFVWGHALAAGFFMGYLALTKILFGYVVEVSLILALLVYGMRRRELVWRSLLVCGLALLVTTPYLVYTLAATGRVNYWGDSGGISLYWMSTPYAGEYGDWIRRADLEQYPELASHHRDFLNRIEPLPGVEQDDLLKRRALENALGHPLKFAQNWVANWGRLLFNYPYSYTQQKPTTYFYLLPNIFIVVLGMSCLYLAWRNPRLVPPELYVLFAFAFLGLGATSIPSAFGRMLVPFAPFIFLGIVVILARAISLRPMRADAWPADGAPP